MSDFLKEPSNILALLSFVGMITVGFLNFRSAIFGASDEISKGAATLLAEYRQELEKAQNEQKKDHESIQKLKQVIEKNKARHEYEISALRQQLTDLDELRTKQIEEMKIAHAAEIKKLQENIMTMTKNNTSLNQKYNALKSEYCGTKKENDELLKRIEKLEKGDTGPLAKGKEE